MTVVFVFVLSVNNHTAAAAQTTTRVGPERRALNGHRFLPASDLPDAFVNTFMRSAVGAGSAINLRAPVEDLDGNVVDTLDGSIAFLALDYEYQQAVNRWLAFRANVTGGARLGTDEQALLFQGVTGVVGAAFGTTVRILERKTVYVAAVGDLAWNQGYFVTPLDWVRDVIDNGLGNDSGKLVADASNLIASGGARVAYSPHRALGLTALAEFGFTEPFREDVAKSRGLVRLGGTIGYDFGTTTALPIGLLGGFRWENFSAGGDDIADRSWRGFFGISYTGRSDFNVGVEMSFARLSQRDSSESIDSGQVRVALRYYF
jgi:hypothetical protein